MIEEGKQIGIDEKIIKQNEKNKNDNLESQV